MIHLYFDGSKTAQTGCGFVIKRDHKIIAEGFKTLHSSTSNVAEYAGFIYGLTKVTSLLEPGEPLKIFGDSQLVINQVSGTYKVKADHLKPLCELAKDRIEALKQDGHEVTLQWIRRDGNKQADHLASKASRSPSRSGPNEGAITEETQDHV